jgi:hypothetical protein
MNRKEIRLYARGLIFEYSEKPLGMFKDESSEEIALNTMINKAQENVEVDLLPEVDWFFRKPLLISVQANKRVYTIKSGGDINCSDFFLFKNIFHNETGRKPHGLLYAEPDQFVQYGIIVGQKGDPKLWSYESADSIAFDPTPAATIADRYKGLYYFDLPDLNQDTEHDPDTNKYAKPAVPKPAHILVAIDTARQCLVISGDSLGPLDELYAKQRADALSLISIKPSLSNRWRPPIKTMIR